MPISTEREYRAMPVMASQNNENEKRYIVEGFATTFNEPYLLYEDGDVKFFEQVERNAFDNADTTDVIFQYNHKGRVFARTKMKQGKEPTLKLDVQDKGLFISADLSSTSESRAMYEDIDTGLIYQMSFAFTVEDEEVKKLDNGNYLRSIKSFKKIYDVSAVDFPANPATDIASRSFEGYIEKEREEFANKLAREKQKQKIRILTEVQK